MPLQIAKSILAVYAWIVVGVLFVFLWRIASFFGRASRQRVRHRLLVLPGVLLAAGVVWYLLHNRDFVGEPVGDLLLFSGGSLLFLFSSRLERLMTGER
jgi:ABC-type Fe3+ transport system permease subunit